MPAARARLRFGPGELGRKPLPEHTLAGEFAFQDLTLRYVDTMPPLVGVSGSATFTGQRMDFAVASGHVGDLALDQGSVAITGIGIEGRDTTQLEIATRVAGPVAQALSLIDQPPLGFASKIGIAPDAASGQVVADLRIGMPLHKELEPEEEARVAADATIIDAALTGKPVNLSEGQLKLTVTEQAAKLAGEAVVEGVPVKFQVQESLGERRGRQPPLSGGGIARCRHAEAVRRGAADHARGSGRRDGNRDRAARRADRRDRVGSHAHRHSRSAAELAQGIRRTGHADGHGGDPGRRSDRGHGIRADEQGPDAKGNLEAQLEPLRLARLQLDQVRFGETRATIAARQERFRRL